jgi:hypothetical protein
MLAISLSLWRLTMRVRTRSAMAIATMLLASACFHATIETGLPASTTVITKPWAHGFIFGLIAPETVATASTCKNGVAKVETQHSFLNMLASFVTFNLYTPIQIDVTCASSNRMSMVPGENGVIRAENTSPEGIAAALQKAASASELSGQPSYIVF